MLLQNLCKTLTRLSSKSLWPKWKITTHPKPSNAIKTNILSTPTVLLSRCPSFRYNSFSQPSLVTSWWFMDIFYQRWSESSSFFGIPRVPSRWKKKKGEAGNRGRCRLSQSSRALIKAIHHVQIIRQQHGSRCHVPSITSRAHFVRAATNIHFSVFADGDGKASRDKSNLPYGRQPVRASRSLWPIKWRVNTADP